MDKNRGYDNDRRGKTAPERTRTRNISGCGSIMKKEEATSRMIRCMVPTSQIVPDISSSPGTTSLLVCALP